MTTASAHMAHNHRDFTPASKPQRGFVSYVKMLGEAFSEGMQMAADARRKHPFADV